MPVTPIEWRDNRLFLLDQTLLPGETKTVVCSSVEDVRDAIRRLVVRGAPAIGVAAAFGVVLGAHASPAKRHVELLRDVSDAADRIGSARPTAVNLFWALSRLKTVAEELRDQPIPDIKEALLDESLRIIHEDRQVSHRIGELGQALIPDGSGVLTHCNAGGLATAEYGTALAALFTAHEKGKEIHVFADETRPLLQGARLTTWELQQAGIPVTLICDNMAAVVMNQGKVQCVIVGADRIAANGDTANKIGTYGLAVLAKAHDIPFYVAAPVSTFDLTLESGAEIPIEERPAEEITEGMGRRIAPDDTEVYNPAFDVTPARYITAIITERGIIDNPSKKTILLVLS
ncbi:MAG: S-methyl-5-thioribose-1-phosphate isomerase [Phycisphaerae bacterium]|nr:S-methyl-5-thioribose-1-phosphate isomerase [Phycisphaerae bacterium]